MKSVIIKLCFLMFICTSGSAQELSFYADVMVNADEGKNRLFANEKFVEGFEELLNEPGSFDNKFEDYKWISIQYSADQSIRCITWQIDRGDESWRYYGYVQESDGTYEKFATDRGAKGLKESQNLNLNNWSGALIYAVLPTGDTQQHTILTYRKKDKYTEVKTMEVLKKVDGEWMLGDDIFQVAEGKDEYKKRLVQEYSSDSNTTLNYDPELKKVVYDNLISVMGRQPGQGPTKVADGSYRAFQYKEGKWMNIDKLFHQILNEPPSGRKRASNQNLDLFGRKKN